MKLLSSCKFQTGGNSHPPTESLSNFMQFSGEQVCKGGTLKCGCCYNL